MSVSFARLLLASTVALSLASCAPPVDDGGDDSEIPDLADTDGDGIADEHEDRPSADTDGDGTPDYLDDDSDGDGIPDYREAGDDLTGTPPLDSDGDGTPDFRDTDSDDNGRTDDLDGVADLDGDGRGNFADDDDDGDAIPDVMEIGPAVNMPLDTDSDGTPDFQDIDSDSDNILDRHEGATDPDGDGSPAYRDGDSDGDCVADAFEAGDNDLMTSPVDTDGDLQKDFLDLDSDNDGLLDSLEDDNCNGVADPTESSRTSADTDGDGATDLIEQAAGTDPTSGSDNPQSNGDFVFIVPYNDNPSPAEDTLDFATDITQADVVFAMDTTGSMGEEIGNLKSSVSSLIGTIRGQIPNTAFGVVGYRDFPTGTYGNGGDQPFSLMHRVMTTNTATGLASVQNRVNAYAHGGGYDTPESGWEMLYQLATGNGVGVGGASVAAFNPGSAYPATAPAGEQLGDIGGVGFRSGSLPIAVWITDACNHNSDLGYGYNFGGAATRGSAINQLNALSARVIGVVSSPGVCANDDARKDALHAVNQTDAVVPPDAWGPVGVRPGNCAINQCCTGIGGAGEGTSGGMCPLIFRVNGSNGAGLGNSVATAVKVLASYAEFDIGGLAEDDPSDSVDAVTAFVDRIEANPSAGAPCAGGLVAIDTNADTVSDTFSGVNPGTTVCFDVVPKENTTVEPLETPQMFKANVVVRGDGVTTLDTRTVWFLVPPEIPDVPID